MTDSPFPDAIVERRPGLVLIAAAVAVFGVSGVLWAYFLGDTLILKGIALFAGALVAGLIFVEPLIGLCLMVFLVPVEEVKPLAGGWLTPTKVVGVVTFAAFLVNARLRRGMLRFDKQSRWMLAFAAWMALSSFWARGEPLAPLFLVLTVAQLALFWVLLRAAVTTDQELSAVSISFIAGTLAGIVAAAIVPRGGMAPRLMYTTGNPNHLARDIVVALILLLYYAPGKRSRTSVAAVTAGGILLLGLALTQSRAGWLGALLCVPLVLIGHRRAGSLAALALMLSLAVALFSMGVLSAHLGVSDAALANRGESIFHARVLRASRLDIWSAGLRLGLRHPVLGVGAGAFLRSVPEVIETMPDYLGASAEIDAHNSFLSAFAELGVIGLLLLTGILWHCARAIARHPRSLEKMAAWALFISAVVQMFTMTAHYQKTIWFSLAVSQVLVARRTGLRDVSHDAFAS